MVVTLPHPDGAGEISQVGIPAKLRRTPGKARTPGPGLGQHSTEILEAAGYTGEQIEGFISSGLVSSS
jgi:crotonobetainyl-CoA:carnitine CoA-transferase CaiB-like acyl-CoA transferase